MAVEPPLPPPVEPPPLEPDVLPKGVQLFQYGRLESTSFSPSAMHMVVWDTHPVRKNVFECSKCVCVSPLESQGSFCNV